MMRIKGIVNFGSVIFVYSLIYTLVYKNWLISTAIVVIYIIFILIVKFFSTDKARDEEITNKD
jgi:uncharacterized membrane protein